MGRHVKVARGHVHNIRFGGSGWGERTLIMLVFKIFWWTQLTTSTTTYGREALLTNIQVSLLENKSTRGLICHCYCAITVGYGTDRADLFTLGTTPNGNT